MEFDISFMQAGFLGLGGGLLLSGVLWIVGLLFSLCINAISKS